MSDTPLLATSDSPNTLLPTQMGDILPMASVGTMSLTVDLTLLPMRGAITGSNIALLTPTPKIGVITTNPTVVHTLLPRTGVATASLLVALLLLPGIGDTLARLLAALTLLPRTSVVSFSDPRPRAQQLICMIVQQLEAQLRNLSAVTENLSRVQTAQLVVQPAPQAPQGAKPANQPTRTQASQDAKPAQAQAPIPRMNSSKHASRDARSYPNLPSAPQQDLPRQPLGGIPVPGVAPTYASAARTAASSAAPAVNLAPTRERHPWLLEMDEIFAIDFPDDYRRVMPASWGTRWDRDHLVFATKQGLEDGAYPGICQNIFGARRNGCKEGTKCKLQHTWFVREDLLCYASNPDPVKLETSKNWLREAVHNVIANYKRGHVDPNHPLPIPPRTGRLPPYVPRRATASSVTPAPTPATARGDTPAPATARGDTRATAGGDTPTNGGQAPARPRDATTGDSARSRGSSPAGAFVPPTGGIEDFCNDLESETPIPPNPASRWNNFPRSIAADDREIAARNALRAAAFAATGQPPFLAREHYRSLSADGWRSTGTFAPIGSTHTGPDPRGSEYEGLPDYGAQPQEPHW
jgi:hypothetical protein